MAVAKESVSRDVRCLNCPVSHHAICSVMSDIDHHELSEIMVHRHLAAGSQIIHQDEDSGLFAIVVSGTIKLINVLADGRQQIVGLLSEADCLGEVFSSRDSENAECVTDVHLCCFDRKRFQNVMKAHPELERRLLQKALNDLRDARHWMSALGRKNSLEKVATFLVWLQSKAQTHCLRNHGQNDFTIINLPFTRSEIGDFLGLTIETVSRTFTKLRIMGVIIITGNRSIEILNSEALRRIAENDE